MTTRPLSRRTLLRGAAGVAMGLPLLEAMAPRTARAQAAALPRRIIFVFKPNGDQVGTRVAPNPTETGFVLGDFLSPLQPYRQNLLVMEGISKRFSALNDTELADRHEQGGAGLAPWPSGSGSYPVGGTSRYVGFVQGPSADIEIGNRVLAANPQLPYRSLVFRVGGRSNDIWSVASHGGPVGTQNPISPETDPYAAYTRLFSFLNQSSAAAVQQKLLQKQSALDLVLGELNTLRGKVGTGDQARLDRHTQALRDIEHALQTPGQGGAQCVGFNAGTPIDPLNDLNYDVVGQLFFKIIGLAYACDLTRVTQFAWSGNTSDRVYNALGLTEGHHTISHRTDATSFQQIHSIKKQLWTEDLNLYQTLQAIPEGSGTLWDNTLIVHWDELDEGDTHADTNNLVVFTGGAQGTFRMGRYLDFSNQTANGFADMLVSCFQYMGFSDVTSFGDPRFNTGMPLQGLT